MGCVTGAQRERIRREIDRLTRERVARTDRVERELARKASVECWSCGGDWADCTPGCGTCWARRKNREMAA